MNCSSVKEESIVRIQQTNYTIIWMIGKILFISDNNGHHFVDDARKSWREHGYDIEDIDFEDIINSPSLDEYFLISLIMDEHNNRLFNEYGKTLRQRTTRPIVFFPYGNTSSDEKIALLNSVADEVIGLPTDVDVAIANCIALVRHYTNSSADDNYKSPTLLLDDKILLDVNRYIVHVNGREIGLRKKECDILFYLMKHKYIIMTYEQIFEAVWGKEYVDNSKNILWNQIRNLRHKIQYCSNLPEYIVTKRGVGYSFAPHYILKK